MRPMIAVQRRMRSTASAHPSLCLQLLFLTLCALFRSANTSQCFMQPDGSMPLAGRCAGQIERTAIRRANATYFNKCPLDQVPYYPDGNSSAQIKCGECRPGTSGADDRDRNCGINDYCTDDGRCRHARLSPYYGKPCPYEGGAMCGPGLSCIQHVCQICEEGVYDPSDGKMCHSGQWTYSEWDTMNSNPQAVMLLIITILLLIALIRPLLVRKGSWKKGYFFKLLRKNAHSKKLLKWSDNSLQGAINYVFQRREREDVRRRRRSSIPIPPSIPRISPKEEEHARSQGLESDNEDLEMEDMRASTGVSFSVATVRTERPAVILKPAEMGDQEASADSESDYSDDQDTWPEAQQNADHNGDNAASKGRTKRRRRPDARPPGKFIPTLARPRQFGYHTTKEEWEASEEARQQ